MLPDARIVNIVAALLVVTAMVMHSVCLSGANLAQMEMHSFIAKINQTMRENEDVYPQKTLDMLAWVQKIESQIVAKDSIMRYGVSKMCFEMTMESFSVDTCVSWDGIFTKDERMTFNSPGWQRGVAGCFVCALILMIISAILCNTIVHIKSRGDRRRLVARIICGTSAVAAIAILAGDFIVASNYEEYSSLNILIKSFNTDIYLIVTDVMSSVTTLSWAFTLDIFAAIFMLIASVLFFLVVREYAKEDKLGGGHLDHRPLDTPDDNLF